MGEEEEDEESGAPEGVMRVELLVDAAVAVAAAFAVVEELELLALLLLLLNVAAFTIGEQTCKWEIKLLVLDGAIIKG